MTDLLPDSNTSPSPAEPAPREFDMLCESCGYSLIGIMSDRCPECGKTFDPTELPLARIPWLYRKRLGVVSAYLQTTMMILTRGKTFAAEMCRPVRISAEDARAYRQLSILIALLSVAFALAFATLAAVLVDHAAGRALVAMICISSFAIPGAAILFTLGTDMPTFIWRGLPSAPNTLAPLHHYAAAPLSLLAPLAIVGAVVTTIDRYEGGPLTLIITLLLVGFAFLLWMTPLVLMRGSRTCSSARVTMLAIYLPFHWLLIGFMCAMGFGGGVGLFRAMFFGMGF